MNIQIRSYFCLFWCLNSIFGIQSLDVNDDSDQLEIYKHIFARLNALLQVNEFLTQDIKQLHKKIELVGGKLENKQKFEISDEFKSVDVQVISNCNSNKAADNPGVYCFGDNWIIIQRRTDGTEDFYRDWHDYKQGFGNKSNEFFFGLEKIYYLTSATPHELLILMTDFDNQSRYAKYDRFEIGSELENYRLKTLGAYSGNAGDALSYHKGSNFSTKDRDNDQHPGLKCAQKFMGAWWYKACHESNLNGCYTDANLRDPKKSIACGIHWRGFRGQWYSLKSIQIMIRPKP